MTARPLTDHEADLVRHHRLPIIAPQAEINRRAAMQQRDPFWLRAAGIIASVTVLAILCGVDPIGAYAEHRWQADQVEVK